MSKALQIESLLLRIADERRRIILVAAESDALPPTGLLSRLADLDRAALAIEAVLEENENDERSRPSNWRAEDTG